MRQRLATTATTPKNTNHWQRQQGQNQVALVEVALVTTASLTAAIELGTVTAKTIITVGIEPELALGRLRRRRGEGRLLWPQPKQSVNLIFYSEIIRQGLQGCCPRSTE